MKTELKRLKIREHWRIYRFWPRFGPNFPPCYFVFGWRKKIIIVEDLLIDKSITVYCYFFHRVVTSCLNLTIQFCSWNQDRKEDGYTSGQQQRVHSLYSFKIRKRSGLLASCDFDWQSQTIRTVHKTCCCILLSLGLEYKSGFTTAVYWHWE